jgi:hypothetical protein
MNKAQKILLAIALVGALATSAAAAAGTTLSLVG